MSSADPTPRRGGPSLATFLDGVRPYLSSALIPEASFLDLRQLTDRLPLALSNDFGFERVLGRASPTVDFCLGVDRGSAGATILAARPNQIELPEAWEEHAAWRIARDFASRIDGQFPAPADPVCGLFLEFDSPTHAARLPTPGLYVTLDQSAGLDTAVITNDLLPRLAGGGLGPGSLERVLDCISAIPSPGRVVYVGLMHGRSSAAPRLSVLLPSMTHVLVLLERLRWEGLNEHGNSPVLTRAAELHDHFCLTLEFGEQLRPRIGIECFFRGLSQPNKEPRWSLFLNELVERQLCQRDECEALLDLCGAKRQNLPLPTLVMPAINHTKLVVEPGSPLRVKAYFGFRLRPLP